jgi:hypothetical protein
MKCNKCGSRAPHLHPAVQSGGEVQPCYDDFHRRVTPENTTAKIHELFAHVIDAVDAVGEVMP